jgi:hypothetical protein
MAYFAEIDQTNTVLQVIAVNNSDVDNYPFPESEPVGQAYIASLGIEGQWLQTSYNANFRGVYAGPGYTYDVALDVFVAPLIPEPEPEPELVEPLA